MRTMAPGRGFYRVSFSRASSKWSSSESESESTLFSLSASSLSGGSSSKSSWEKEHYGHRWIDGIKEDTYWVVDDSDDEAAAGTCRNVLACGELLSGNLETVPAGTRVVVDVLHRVP